MEVWSELIASLGFPIVAVLACGYFIFTMTKQQREDNQRREDRMFDQLDKFGDSLDSFNGTLVKIDSRLEAVEDVVKDLKK